MAPQTKEELRRMNIIDPEFKAEIAKHPLPDMSGSILDRRRKRAAHLAGLRHLYPLPGAVPEVLESAIEIPARDGYAIPARLYQPAAESAPAGGSPVVLMFHEGGFSMGDLTDEDLNCRMLARDLGAVCVNVDYRLAPEHVFPTGINDCWDALRWVARNAASLRGNAGAGLVVGGASAGGNIAAVLAHLARDEELDPPLTGQYLCVPTVLPATEVPEQYKDEYLSYYENRDDPVLVMSRTPPYEQLRETLKMDLKSPLFAPFLDPKGHKGVARAYLQVCGMDPLRDEGLLYERVLREEAGVETRLDLYSGFGHIFWTNFPGMERSKQFVQDTLEGFRWLLKR